MAPHGLFPEHLMSDFLPFIFLMILAALIILPAITFGIARKWGQAQPDIATGALAGAVIVSVLGILATVFFALAVVGWIPPLQQLLQGSAGS